LCVKDDGFRLKEQKSAVATAGAVRVTPSRLAPGRAIRSCGCRNTERPIRSTLQFQGGSIVHAHAVFVALALILAPLAANAADLVVWWEKGYYDQEDEAVREIVAAFEQETGKQVDLVFQQQNELPQKISAALGGPPARLRFWPLDC
jgi:hypothetical protein